MCESTTTFSPLCGMLLAEGLDAFRLFFEQLLCTILSCTDYCSRQTLFFGHQNMEPCLYQSQYHTRYILVLVVVYETRTSCRHAYTVVLIVEARYIVLCIWLAARRPALLLVIILSHSPVRGTSGSTVKSVLLCRLLWCVLLCYSLLFLVQYTVNPSSFVVTLYTLVLFCGKRQQNTVFSRAIIGMSKQPPGGVCSF